MQYFSDLNILHSVFSLILVSYVYLDLLIYLINISLFLPEPIRVLEQTLTSLNLTQCTTSRC